MSFAQLRSTIARPALRSRSFATAPPPKRTPIILKNHVYIAHATAEGQGRNGRVSSGGDAPLDFKMTPPKAMGGKGDGQDPEQLFAMGYSSCFLGAIQLAASRAGKKEIGDRAKIHTSVFLGHPTDREGFGLRVEIKVEGVEDDSLISAAHEMCPYSRALREGVVVEVGKV